LALCVFGMTAAAAFYRRAVVLSLLQPAPNTPTAASMHRRHKSGVKTLRVQRRIDHTV
jgi:hypothetical protein